VDHSGRDLQLRTQEPRELLECGHLPCGGAGLLEIPDQTDSDAMGIEKVIRPPRTEETPAGIVAMRTGNLPSPA
jgi:hypothetical protein